ncbi:hypothetical protein ACIRRH_41850 [Kitasatospora sp. NPDC101235]|uniref:hypothetical protein n=1 Tax=Kitasatospora sp. NPDC101235 TaxID=3364101 RepID=UPI00381C7552
MEITIAGTGLAGGAWPELLPDRRPVLVVPAPAAPPPHPADGWTREAAHPHDTPHPGWAATATPPHLTIHQPTGQPWYDAPLTAGREWWRALRTHEVLLLVTGPFTNVFDFRRAAEAGALALLTVDTVFTTL